MSGGEARDWPTRNSTARDLPTERVSSYCSRLIKDGLCDRSNAPSVSAISRLLRGREGDDDKKLSDGEYPEPCVLTAASLVGNRLAKHSATAVNAVGPSS